MKLAALLVFILTATIYGCKDTAPNKATGPSIPRQAAAVPTPEEASHNLIIRYNHLLSEGYKSTNMTRLQEVATTELAEKAYYHMAAIGEGKRRMVSELKKINFVTTDCSKLSLCKVVTREWWDFSYADILTGKRSTEVKNYIYDVQYQLANRQGRWILTEINATGEERQEIPTWGKMFRKG